MQKLLDFSKSETGLSAGIPEIPFELVLGPFTTQPLQASWNRVQRGCVIVDKAMSPLAPGKV